MTVIKLAHSTHMKSETQTMSAIADIDLQIVRPSTCQNPTSMRGQPTARGRAPLSAGPLRKNKEALIRPSEAAAAIEATAEVTVTLTEDIAFETLMTRNVRERRMRRSTCRKRGAEVVNGRDGNEPTDGANLARDGSDQTAAHR